MSITTIAGLTLGSTVRFRTKSPHDNVLWSGRVSSICDYDTARQFSDVDSTYAEVRNVEPTLPAKEKLVYFILLVQEDTADPTIVTRRVFASEWVDQGSFEVVNENTYTDIRVYDVDANSVDNIITLLKAHGYISTVLATDISS